MLKQPFFDAIFGTVTGTVKTCRLTLNGTNVDIPALKSIRKDNKLTVYFYVEEGEGVISHIALLDGDGRELQSKHVNIQKTQEGLAFALPVVIRTEG